MRIFESDRSKGRYQLHAWVIMPDHVHLLLTPAPEVSLEKALQFIKGGFSFRLKAKGEVWQRSFADHRISNLADFHHHAMYIEQNPIRAQLSAGQKQYLYTSEAHPSSIDSMPPYFGGSRG